MKADHVFTPRLLALDQPITFAPLIDLPGVSSRMPAADMAASPWFQYSTRVMAMFYSDGVTEDMTSWFARALAEAHEMGLHGISPDAPGHKRPPFKTRGEKEPVVRAAITSGTRPGSTEKPNPEPTTSHAPARRVRAVAAPVALAPSPLIAKRIVRRT